MAMNSMRELYVEQLRDLYSAEQQILDALPKMAKRAQHDELRSAFEQHQMQTEEQVRRLDRIAGDLGIKLKGDTCEGMKGLIKEGEQMMKNHGDADVRDAALIAAAQRVEHYEIAGYGCARTYARLLGREEDAQLLQQTLDEEGKTDHRLTSLAERVVNIDALRAD